MGIQTWDLSVCLYLNLKHGDLDHPAIMASCDFELLVHLYNAPHFYRKMNIFMILYNMS